MKTETPPGYSRLHPKPVTLRVKGLKKYEKDDATVYLAVGGESSLTMNYEYYSCESKPGFTLTELAAVMTDVIEGHDMPKEDSRTSPETLAEVLVYVKKIQYLLEDS